MLINYYFDSDAIRGIVNLGAEIDALVEPDVSSLEAALESFGSNLSYDSISATEVLISDGIYGLEIAGTGFGPVSTFDAFLQALETGTATGTLSTITLTEYSPLVSDLFQITFDDDGYTLQVQDIVFSINGDLPASLDDLFGTVEALSDLLNGTEDLASLSSDALALMDTYSFDGLSLVYGDTSLLNVDLSDEAVSVSVMGYTLELRADLSDFTGSFSNLIGSINDASSAIELGLEGMSLIGPDDAVLVDLVVTDDGYADYLDRAVFLDGIEVAYVGLDMSALFGQADFYTSIYGPGDGTLFSIAPSEPIGGSYYDDVVYLLDDYATFYGIYGTDTVVFNYASTDVTINDLGGFEFEVITADGMYTLYDVEYLTFTDMTIGLLAEGDDLDGTDATDDSILGTDANDTLDAGRGNDTLDGGFGDDNVWGDGGDDLIYGWDGEDTLRGGRQDDTIYGEYGDDSIVGQRNKDFLNGGSGDDTVKGGGGSDTMLGGQGDDFMKGGTFADWIQGDDGHDTLLGNRHDDTLLGGWGDDSLNGGGDDDYLDGGAGDDWMRGGSGEDIFAFVGSTTGDDTIDDFNTSEDILALDEDDYVSVASILNGMSIVDGGLLLQLEGGTLYLDGVTNAASVLGATELFDFG